VPTPPDSAEPEAAAAAARTVLTRRNADGSDPGADASWWQQLRGLTLDHYKITGRIASGGMGAVFRATDQRLKRDVALKVLPPEHCQDPELVQRFHQEAQAAAQLDHDNIARVYYIGQDQGLHYIAFEFVAGTNIRDMLAERGRMKIDESIDYVMQVARALRHSASRGVVHRDIKPSNLIVTPGGRVKLVDMGLARHFERRRDSDLTQTGVTMGTFDYISPEQARDPRTADIRSDIYSLGCTFYHMLTGQPPFPHGTVLQKLLQHQAETPPDPRQLNAELPSNLSRLVARMIAKRAEDRYQTPETALTALQEVGREIRAARRAARQRQEVGQTGATAGLRWWERHLIWVGPVVVLLISVAIIYGTRERPGETQPNPPIVSPPDPGGPNRTGAPPWQDTASGTVVRVGPGDDLRAAFRNAPSGSVIVLTASGPDQAYNPATGRPEGEPLALQVRRKRLTLKAAEDATPVIRLTHFPQTGDVGAWALLDLVDSYVTLEGLCFELDAGTGAEPMQALRVRGGKLEVRRCRFQQHKPLSAESRVTAIQLRPGQYPLQADIRQCFLQGGQHALDVAGAGGHIRLTDCVVAGFAQAIRVAGDGQQPLTLRVSHVTGLAGDGPFFHLAHKSLSLNLKRSIFSSVEPTGVLAAATDPAALKGNWDAAHNLYHGFASLLARADGRDTVPLADDLPELRSRLDDPDTEESSLVADPLFAGPLQDGTGGYVLEAFRVQPGSPAAPANPGDPLIGAMLPGGVASAGATSPPESGQRDATAGHATPPATVGERTEPEPPERPAATEQPTTGRQTPPAAPRTDEMDPWEELLAGPLGQGDFPFDLPGITKPTEPAKPATPPAGPGAGKTPDGPGAGPRVDVPDRPGDGAGQRIVDPHSPMHYASLTAACRDARDGDTIRIRHNGQLGDLSIEIADKHLTLMAEEGFSPVLKVNTEEPLPGGDRDAQLFYLEGGSLRLVGLDLDLHVPDDAPPRPWAFIRADDADVSLEHCTVTVSGAHAVGAVVVELSRRAGRPRDPAFVPRVRLAECYVRGVTDAIRIIERSAAEVTVTDSVILANQVLLRYGGTDLVPGAAVRAVRLQLVHCTLVVGGGVLAIDTPDPTRELVPLSVQVSRSIVCGPKRDDGALVSARVWPNQASPMEMVTWQSDRSLYVDTDSCLRIVAAGAEQPEVVWGMRPWQEHWQAELQAESTDRVAPQAGFLGGPVKLSEAHLRKRASLNLRADSPAAAPADGRDPLGPRPPEPAEGDDASHLD